METALIAFTGMKKAPERIRVFKTGEIFYKNKKYTYTREDLAQMVENFNREGIDIPVDYEHQTLSGEKAPAAGWVKKLELKGEDLWATVRWTDEARQLIETKKYRYISPVIMRNMKDGETGKNIGTYLHSVAVTNQPHIRDLFDLAASEISVTTEGQTAEVIRGADGVRREVIVMNIDMDENKEKEMKEIIKELDLKEDATEEDAIQKVMELKQAAEKEPEVPAEIVEAVGLKADAPPEKVAATIREALRQAETEKSGMAEDYTALKSDFEKFRADVEKERAEREVEGLIDTKILPKDRDTYVALRLKDPDMFKKVVESLPEHGLMKRVIPPGSGMPDFAKPIDGVDQESLELESKAEAYSKKHDVPYDDALKAVSKGGE